MLFPTRDSSPPGFTGRFRICGRVKGHHPENEKCDDFILLRKLFRVDIACG
jgi:hypothetical protein